MSLLCFVRMQEEEDEKNNLMRADRNPFRDRQMRQVPMDKYNLYRVCDCEGFSIAVQHRTYFAFSHSY